MSSRGWKERLKAMQLGHVQHVADVLQRTAREYRGDPKVGEKISLGAEIFAGAALRLAELRDQSPADYLVWRARVLAAPTAPDLHALVKNYVDAIPLYHRLRLPATGWQALTRSANLIESADQLRELASTFRGEPELALLIGECSSVFDAGAWRLRELAAR